MIYQEGDFLRLEGRVKSVHGDEIELDCMPGYLVKPLVILLHRPSINRVLIGERFRYNGAMYSVVYKNKIKFIGENKDGGLTMVDEAKMAQCHFLKEEVMNLVGGDLIPPDRHPWGREPQIGIGIAVNPIDDDF